MTLNFLTGWDLYKSIWCSIILQINDGFTLLLMVTSNPGADKLSVIRSPVRLIVCAVSKPVVIQSRYLFMV